MNPPPVQVLVQGLPRAEDALHFSQGGLTAFRIQFLEPMLPLLQLALQLGRLSARVAISQRKEEHITMQRAHTITHPLMCPLVHEEPCHVVGERGLDPPRLADCIDGGAQTHDKERKHETPTRCHTTRWRLKRSKGHYSTKLRSEGGVQEHVAQAQQAKHGPGDVDKVAQGVLLCRCRAASGRCNQGKKKGASKTRGSKGKKRKTWRGAVLKFSETYGPQKGHGQGQPRQVEAKEPALFVWPLRGIRVRREGGKLRRKASTTQQTRGGGGGKPRRDYAAWQR